MLYGFWTTRRELFCMLYWRTCTHCDFCHPSQLARSRPVKFEDFPVMASQLASKIPCYDFTLGV